MASRSCVVSIGGRVASARSLSRSCASSAGALAQANPYASGTNFSRNALDAKSWLPGARVQMVDKDGYITPPWYRFFTYVAEQRLGGINGPTMTEVQSNVVDTKVQAVNAAASAAAVGQQAISNAEVLAAAVEVAQNNSLAGAASIPPVVRRPYNVSTLEP